MNPSRSSTVLPLTILKESLVNFEVLLFFLVSFTWRGEGSYISRGVYDRMCSSGSLLHSWSHPLDSAGAVGAFPAMSDQWRWASSGPNRPNRESERPFIFVVTCRCKWIRVVTCCSPLGPLLRCYDLMTRNKSKKKRFYPVTSGTQWSYVEGLPVFLYSLETLQACRGDQCLY